MQIRVWLDDQDQLLVESDHNRPVAFGPVGPDDGSARWRGQIADEVVTYVEALLQGALRDRDARVRRDREQRSKID